ncbi:hypothetical protein BBBOND_0300570 [Babesia bigemina]|uniref:Uncharacterized protein n=1 Tax=Babesia bigemina TaxID=5866 RepID=A0A061D829_BABBI|nr:hypothetical protein BBBOND_0300570 [Babesia bigemina]CDR96152.1 hypothetical protein BBBOND_0300570 [Babesia bigemina]|eukprot:XP_012768338.1 hypothetical protein BBBOND_0300570 [Babesia bigemina]
MVARAIRPVWARVALTECYYSLGVMSLSTCSNIRLRILVKCALPWSYSTESSCLLILDMPVCQVCLAGDPGIEAMLLLFRRSWMSILSSLGGLVPSVFAYDLHRYHGNPPHLTTLNSYNCLSSALVFGHTQS